MAPRRKGKPPAERAPSEPLPNDKHERFAREYILDLNSTQAAIRAGYSERSARSQGHRLITNADMLQRVGYLQAQAVDKLDLKAERVLEELMRIGFADIRDYARWDGQGVWLQPSTGLTPAQAAAVAEVSSNETQWGTNVRFKLHDKLGSLSKLGEHLKLFVQKVEEVSDRTITVRFE